MISCSLKGLRALEGNVLAVHGPGGGRVSLKHCGRGRRSFWRQQKNGIVVKELQHKSSTLPTWGQNTARTKYYRISQDIMVLKAGKSFSKIARSCKSSFNGRSFALSTSSSSSSSSSSTASSPPLISLKSSFHRDNGYVWKSWTRCVNGISVCGQRNDDDEEEEKECSKEEISKGIWVCALPPVKRHGQAIPHLAPGKRRKRITSFDSFGFSKKMDPLTPGNSLAVSMRTLVITTPSSYNKTSFREKRRTAVEGDRKDKDNDHPRSEDSINAQSTSFSTEQNLKKEGTNDAGKSKSQHKNSSSDVKNLNEIDEDFLPSMGRLLGVEMNTSAMMVFRAMGGNLLITVLKFGAWLKTGSSAMLSEAVHSLVDTGNQALLVLGVRQAAMSPDKRHQYGYGRAAYFWSLISALGMFWLGAGFTISHGIDTLLHPPPSLNVSWETWSILGMSFMIDGWVLSKVYQELRSSQPPSLSFFQHLRTIKDPFIMAVLLEDTSACLGVLLAVAGIGATQITGNLMWDSMASISIGGLLGYVALRLVRLNKRYLLGQSVEPEIEAGIRSLLMNRPSIENVYDVQSQWVGPSTFSFKAEVDFDGTYLAAKLMNSYRDVFLEADDLKKDLPLLLAWYAEDVTRLVEKEVKEAEAQIRHRYPEAVFIELEPDSKDSYTQAIDCMTTHSERKLEREALNRAIADLTRTLERVKKSGETPEGRKGDIENDKGESDSGQRSSTTTNQISSMRKPE